MDVPVIVVGGGPVGQCVALALARYGVRSMLIEKQTCPSTESRALAIWPRTLEHLADWGVAGALRAAGIFGREVRVTGAKGNALLSIDFGVLDDVVDQPGALVIPQYETERVLRAAVAASGRCDVRAGCEALGLSQDDDGVNVRVLEGGQERTLRCAYVVGCDGAHGVVRHALGFALEGITYRTRAVLSDELLDTGDTLDGVHARIATNSATLLFGIRFAPRAWRLIGFVPDAMDDETALSPAVHDQRVRGVLGMDTRTTTTWKSLFALHRRQAPRFVQERIVLAGDAAHLVSPAGGEGMNAGMQDAANLAWRLACATRGDGDAAALLDAYDRERRQMLADTVDKMSDRITRVGALPSAWVRALLLTAAGLALRGKGMQRKAARAFGMLDGRYTRSPLIDTRHPLAGKRIDDLRLPGGERLNRLRAGGAALVVVGRASIGWPDAIVVERAPKRWCVRTPAAIVVRPDGIVAAVVERPTHEKIEAAWTHAFAGASPPRCMPRM